MRKLLVFFLFLGCCLPACAQQPIPTAAPAGSNWQRVQALPAGASIYVNGKDHARCFFTHADADSISCGKTNDAGAKELTFQRPGVTSIKLTHRGRSTLVGLGIGAGTGAIIGFAVGTDNNPDAFFGKNFLRGAVTAVFALFGAVIGSPVGYFTDFTRSTIYRAP